MLTAGKWFGFVIQNVYELLIWGLGVSTFNNNCLLRCSVVCCSWTCMFQSFWWCNSWLRHSLSSLFAPSCIHYLGVFMFSNRREKRGRRRRMRRGPQQPICRDWRLRWPRCSNWSRPSDSCIPVYLLPSEVKLLRHTHTQPGCLFI